MCAVGDEDIFLPIDAIHDGDNRVNAIDEEYEYPLKRSRASDELKKHEHLHERYGNAAHVAGEAARVFAEVEIEEHHHRYDHTDDQAGVTEVDDLVVDVIERHEVGQSVDAGHAVDAVHEVEGVEGANAHDKHKHYQPQGMGVHSRVPHDHGEGRHLRGQAYERVLAVKVVDKTHHRQDRHADHHPGER